MARDTMADIQSPSCAFGLFLNQIFGSGPEEDNPPYDQDGREDFYPFHADYQIQNPGISRGFGS
jgi:hypothetical protein